MEKKRQAQEKKQAHGMTEDQMVDLQYAQNNNEVEFVTANNADDIKDKHFKQFEDWQIPVHEQHVYHVATEQRLFNQATGEKLSEPVVKTFTKEAFEFQKKNHGFVGQDVLILHNPTLANNESKKKVDGDEDEDDDAADLSGETVATLKEKYKEITGEDAPAGIKKADLIQLIKDAQAE